LQLRPWLCAPFALGLDRLVTLLAELWREWGEDVERYWQQRYGEECFAALCAREEGWEALISGAKPVEHDDD
jgi:hypothetical protein